MEAKSENTVIQPHSKIVKSKTNGMIYGQVGLLPTDLTDQALRAL